MTTSMDKLLGIIRREYFFGALCILQLILLTNAVDIVSVRPRRYKTADYQITVETANAFLGGESSCWFHLEMTGANGTRTGWIDLVEENDPKFRRGEIDVLNVVAENVGLPIMIRIGLRDHDNKDPWAIRYVKVKFGDEEAYFPIHDWVQDELWVVTGEGLLHHKVDSPDILSMLDQEVEQNKEILPWIPLPKPSDLAYGLPRFVNTSSFLEVPLIFQPTEVWLDTYNFHVQKGNVYHLTKAILGANITLDSFEKYEIPYEIIENGSAPRSPHIDRWKTDEEFGRQQLNGLIPHAMERCLKIPEVCQISGEHVNPLLEGKTMEERMDEGKIYIADYHKFLNGARRNKNPNGEQLYCADVIGLFYVNSEDNLVPVAIQLIPNDPESIFTPLDSEDDWLLAKMYFRVAFGNMHEWYYHYLLTHGVVEPFGVALFRNFPRSHPLYKLLRPHLHRVSVINSLARQTLIPDDSSTNKGMSISAESIVREAYKEFHMRDLVIPLVIRLKGLDDEKLLPKFYWRDDALELWRIMERFVEEIISIYYKSDEDVVNDKYLAAFLKDVSEEGLGWQDGDAKGLPRRLKKIHQLTRICTILMFTSSAQHAALNFVQFEMYKFTPNTPLGMRLPPHKKGEANMQRILDSLPDIQMTAILLPILRGLSTYSADEAFIGNYPLKLFVEPEAVAAIEKFKNALDEYEENIKGRNAITEYAYIYLLPEMVPNSIGI